MINMDTMKIKATKVEITRRKEDDLPGYKNDHKHYKKSYKKSDGGFNQKMDQEDLKTYTAAFLGWVLTRLTSIGFSSGFGINPVDTEIMKKLPIKSLLQFRSVSKSWKFLIDSSKFIADYQ
ncbi:zinc finger, CCHC-type containing protein [Tanacetum coccineum]